MPGEGTTNYEDFSRNNATLTAMLVYLAANDPERVSGERRSVMPMRGGQESSWPECQPSRRDWSLRR